MRRILCGLSAVLLMLVLARGARAEQFSSGAILATAGAPRQVILRRLAQAAPQAPSAPAEATAEPSPMTPVGAKFPALGSWCAKSTRPDPALAVGPAYVLQMTNRCLAVYDKAGNLQPGFPISLSMLPFYNPRSRMVGPRALYDWVNNRYIVIGGHVTGAFPSDSFVDVGVSWSSDPRDGWFFYSFDMGQIQALFSLHDSPAVGQDRRAIYISLNEDDDFGDLREPALLVLPKPQLYAGQGFNFFLVDLGSIGFEVNGYPLDSIQPANVMNLGDRPRAEFMVSSFNLNFGGHRCVSGCQGLAIWAVSNPVYYPGTSGPEVSRIVIPTANTYYLPSSARQKSCVYSSCQIDTGDVRVSGQVTYASGSLYAALTTNGTPNTPGADTAHILWFEVKPYLNDSDPACTGSAAGKCPQVVDALKLNEVCWDCDKALGSDGSGARFYPTVQPDSEGNVALVFNYSDDTVFPSSAYASNRVSQTAGTMHDGGKALQAGLAFYNPLPGGEVVPWSAYTGAAVDLTPSVQPSMWFTAQASKSLTDYRTAIGHFAYTAPSQP